MLEGQISPAIVKMIFARFLFELVYYTTISPWLELIEFTCIDFRPSCEWPSIIYFHAIMYTLGVDPILRGENWMF